MENMYEIEVKEKSYLEGDFGKSIYIETEKHNGKNANIMMMQTKTTGNLCVQVGEKEKGLREIFMNAGEAKALAEFILSNFN